MSDAYWFHKKWGLNNKSLEDRVSLLENLVKELQERIEALEAENVENSNCFYELSNSIDAVDARIDILTLENWNKKNV
jgi:predicted  nucleic acid-binding Zn-ribbon protein